MMSEKNAPKILGFAFVFVAIASLLSGLPLESFGIALIGVPENLSETMLKIAESPVTLQMSLTGYLIEGSCIVLLSFLLYMVLKEENKILASWGLGLWLIEAAFVGVRQISIFSLLRVSLEYAKEQSAYLYSMGGIFYQSFQFTYCAQMIIYAIGGIIFYGLFYKAKYIPRWLSAWGVIAASLSLIGEIFVIFDYNVSLLVFLPILPFELVIGAWLMLKGVRKNPAEMEKETQ